MFLLSGAALTIVAIVAFILILGTIIALHEAGHLLAAKKAGVLCYDYSIGFGPAIYKRKTGETQFTIRAVPVGGFVQMAGLISFDDDIKREETIGLNLNQDDEITEIILDPSAEAMVRGKCTDLNLTGENGDPRYVVIEEDGESKQYPVASEATYVFEKNTRLGLAPYERTLDAKSKPWRLIVLAAGSTMNFILALVVYLIVSFGYGVADTSSNTIGGLTAGYPAETVVAVEDSSITLKAGDKITAVNGVATDSWTAFSNEMEKVYDSYQTYATIEITRDDNTYTFVIDALTGFNSIGVSNFGAENIKLSLIPNTTIYGLEAGQVYSNYVNSSDSDYALNLAAGDYITGIQIDGVSYDLTTSVDVEGYGTLEGWGYFAYLVDNYIGDGVPEVRYQYYHKTDDEYKFIDYSDAKVVEPYTDEVLSSQSVTKILHYIGVSCTTHRDFFGCIGQAFKMFGEDFTLIFRTLKLLLFPSDVRQVGVSNLSGVVGIFGQVKSYVNKGILPLLAFAAMLSVNIGIVNLLPIPALDGGKILFVIIEAITRKRIPKKVENIINLVFMGLLLILMLYVTVNDIMRI
ncbi:MAG: site-2 protease family protein [Acholeplasmatales bacterium]|nr:site-2 protease family protein [Acholeplasmatales bacterium]